MAQRLEVLQVPRISSGGHRHDVVYLPRLVPADRASEPRPLEHRGSYPAPPPGPVDPRPGYMSPVLQSPDARVAGASPASSTFDNLRASPFGTDCHGPPRNRLTRPQGTLPLPTGADSTPAPSPQLQPASQPPMTREDTTFLPAAPFQHHPVDPLQPSLVRRSPEQPMDVDRSPIVHDGPRPPSGPHPMLALPAPDNRDACPDPREDILPDPEPPGIDSPCRPLRPMLPPPSGARPASPAPDRNPHLAVMAPLRHEPSSVRPLPEPRRCRPLAPAARTRPRTTRHGAAPPRRALAPATVPRPAPPRTSSPPRL